MRNVYDTRKEKNLNYILPLSQHVAKIENYENIAVIIHLYYIDTVEYYLEYVKFIPPQIDIFFTVSSEQIREKLKDNIVIKRKKCKLIEKKNRGRDISAFLVACRKDILRYKYICFMHDKKGKSEKTKRYTETWIKCLWQNMLGSRQYIDNILFTFQENQTLGLLVPPHTISEHSQFYNLWCNDFEGTNSLAQKMGLTCNLDYNKPPITLGTVFWARVSSLKKLLEMEWKYEDFDEEPLKGDGTISHAIERILAYVAQDAGYDTGIVMTDQYAGERFDFEQEALQEAFFRLNDSLGIKNISGLKNYEERKRQLMEFVKQYNCIYVYGAGVYGKSCLAMLKSEMRLPDAFIVTSAQPNDDRLEDIPVYCIDQVKLNEKCGIIIAVSEQYYNDVINTVKKRLNLSNIFLYEYD